MIPSHFQIAFEPAADSAAIVTAPHVRFTVLTSRLLRLEYSSIDQFEDRASQVFGYRRQPVPPFEVERTSDRVVITTEHLKLTYQITPRGLARDTLTIKVNATGKTWRYGDRGRWKNLGGTARTLDGVNGGLELEPGLLSRDGWAVVDDSASVLFADDGRLAARTEGTRVDLYFFGYGHDYLAAIQDFYRVSGPVPLIPRYVLGNWWSRYWAYTQDELTDLMRDFQAHEIPLSVCIVDMDWHITDTGNESTGWTGYTWNRQLFPDPAGFIAWLHAQGLRAALNLHPADGVYPHEEQYIAMARALGLDPAAQQPIEFDVADLEFMRAYFEILHHPYEELGVDFWWLDWQQGTGSKLAGLDPLLALNHLHFYDLGRDGSKRPFIFSRWFGLGNQRYPIGFSGDTVVSWESLAFQPYFTATASNTGYSWWSHDIGGHMQGIEDAELYARWVQFGVFSPILRLHSTNNPYQDRRPWVQDAETFNIIRAALQLRHQLIPYLYTMAWRNHAAGVPLVVPLYYEYPEQEDAYRCPQQYLFGTELIAAPFTTPLDPDTRLSRQQVWLPAGTWFNFFTAERYAGNRWVSVYGARAEIPVFAKEGAIVPLAPRTGWGGVENPDELEVHFFPGAGNRFALYEDDGVSTAYRQGRHCSTVFSQVWYGTGMDVKIQVQPGERSVLPAQRTYRLLFRGIVPPRSVSVLVNGITREVDTLYEATTETFVIGPFNVTPSDEVDVSMTNDNAPLVTWLDRRAEKCRRLLRAFRMESDTKRWIDQYLEDIFDDPAQLKEFGAAVKDAHVEALRSVIEEQAL